MGFYPENKSIGLAKGIKSARDELLQANLRLVVSVAT